MRCVNASYTGISTAESSFFIHVHLKIYIIRLFKGNVFVIRLFVDYRSGMREVMVSVELDLGVCSAYYKAESVCVSVGYRILEENILCARDRYGPVVCFIETAGEDLSLFDEVVVLCGILSADLYRKGSVGILKSAVIVGYDRVATPDSYFGPGGVGARVVEISACAEFIGVELSKILRKNGSPRIRRSRLMTRNVICLLSILLSTCI